MPRTLAVGLVLLGLCACHSDSQADPSQSTKPHALKAVGHGSAPHGSAGGVIGQVLGSFAKHHAHSEPLPEQPSHLHRRG
jgi:hypothetical protein